MVHPFIARLRHAGDLSSEDESHLNALLTHGEKVAAHQFLAQEGKCPNALYIVTQGMACSYKMLLDGKRSIVGLLLPGDLSSVSMASHRTMGHSIITLSRCRLVKLPQHAIRRMMGISPRVAEALSGIALVDEGTLREWLVSMSLRPAVARMSHFFCEVLTRLQAVGLAQTDSFDFPMTQSDLGDVLGLSAVHVNRTLQELRKAKLIVFTDKHVKVPDFERLKALAQFTPGYLRLR